MTPKTFQSPLHVDGKAALSAIYGPWDSVQAAKDFITGEDGLWTELQTGMTIGVIEDGAIVEYWNPADKNTFVKKGTDGIGQLQEALEQKADKTADLFLVLSDIVDNASLNMQSILKGSESEGCSVVYDKTRHTLLLKETLSGVLRPSYYGNWTDADRFGTDSANGRIPFANKIYVCETSTYRWQDGALVLSSVVSDNDAEIADLSQRIVNAEAAAVNAENSAGLAASEAGRVAGVLDSVLALTEVETTSQEAASLTARIEDVNSKLDGIASYEDDNPEFIRAYLDSDGRFLWGIGFDGSIAWSKGIPQPVQEALNALQDYIDNIASEGNITQALEPLNTWKSDIGIDSDTMDGEFIDVTLDSENNVIAGIKSDGKPYCAKPSNQDDLLREEIQAKVSEEDVATIVDDRLESLNIDREMVGRIFPIETVFEKDTSGNEFSYTFSQGKRYAIKNMGVVAATFTLRLIRNGEAVQTVGNIPGHSEIQFTATADANWLRIGNTTEGIRVSVRNLDTLSDRVEALSANLSSDKVRFTYDHDFKDVEVLERSCFGSSLMSKVYECYETLIAAYPELITKFDAANMVGLSYPDYANGISAAGTYQVTPAYKTYMYKISYSNDYVYGSLNTKDNLLLVCGVHGNELAAMYNNYLLAKEICETTDPNLFKLLSHYDIYIVPVLNGYGSIHTTRYNANKVNLNRNFPTELWQEINSNDKESGNWSGASAASEFETQLVMALVELLKPKVVIDHHNYAFLNKQLYTEAYKNEFMPLVVSSFIDCSYAFIKNLPAYFGNKFKIFKETEYDAPKHLSGTMGSVANWATQESMVAATVEISQCINYSNGTLLSHAPAESFTEDVFKVGEYTLRNQVLRLCEFSRNK